MGKPVNRTLEIAAIGKDASGIGHVAGPVVSFRGKGDPLRSLNVNIDPVQDLHGYDNPWPAGGGKNLLAPASIYKLNDDGITITLTNTELNGYPATKAEITGTAASWGWRLCQIGIRDIVQPSTAYRLTLIANAQYNLRWNIISPTSQHTLSGNKTFACTSIGGGLYQYSCEFTTLAADNDGWNYTDQNIMIYANPQTLSPFTITIINNFCLTLQSDPAGWQPYSNLCPISGWSVVNVWRTGGNVWDEEWEVGGINYNTGDNESDNTRIRSKNFISVRPDTVYYYHSTKSLGLRYYDLDKRFIAGANVTVSNITKTTPSNAYYVRFSVVDETTYNHDISINYPSTDHDYHPYSGNQYTIQLGDTYYGGTLDVANGVLTVDRAMTTLNGTEGYWTGPSVGTNYYQFTAWLGAKIGASVTALCDTFSKITLAERGTKTGLASYDADAGFRFALKSDFGVTTIAEWKAYLAAHNVQLVYELATPITIQLTPTEVTTLLGQNNVWADSGDVDVEYSASGGPGGKLAILLRERKELLIALKMGMTQEEAGLLGSLPGMSLGSGFKPGIIKPGASTQDKDEEEEIL